MISNSEIVYQKRQKGLCIKGLTQEKFIVRAGVVVTLINKNNPHETTIKASNAAGAYTFPRLKPSVYLLLATDSKRVFNSVSQDNVVPK